MLKPGDKVIMNDKYYVREADKGRVWTVRSKSWKVGGADVVQLDGMSGAYAVDGLTLVKQI